MNVAIEWHAPDQAFAAIFLRDGQQWYLNGALVGMGHTPGGAVTDLIEIASHLVEHGENFLTEAPLSVPDREWLFKQLDHGDDFEAVQRMYVALRRAVEAAS